MGSYIPLESEKYYESIVSKIEKKSLQYSILELARYNYLPIG